MLKTISLPHFQHSKDCFINVVTEDGNIHMSWLLEDGKVLSFEYIPDNYPAGSYLLWDSQNEYQKEIATMDWIQNNL